MMTLGRFCLLKNNSLTFSLNWFLSVDVNVSAWRKKLELGGKDFKVSPWQWQELCWLWCEVQAWLQYPEACLQSIIYSWYDELHQIVLQAKGYNYDFTIERPVCKQLWCEELTTNCITRKKSKIKLICEVDRPKVK